MPNKLYYLQNGEEYVKPTKAPRAAAELEVKPGRSIEDQIAVVVATLLDQKGEALDTLKTIIQNTITELKTWDQEAEARRLAAEEQGKEFEKLMRQPLCICLSLYSSKYSSVIWKGRIQNDSIQRREIATSPQTCGSRTSWRKR